jgi:hypothetical protein
MIISVDFDGTVVLSAQTYRDLNEPLRLMQHAKQALTALRRADHTLLLCSSRANRALRVDWRLNPLWRNYTVDQTQRWEASREFHEARYQQMIDFVGNELSDIFHAIDDGQQGKVLADLFICDKAQRFGSRGLLWRQIATTWGA